MCIPERKTEGFYKIKEKPANTEAQIIKIYSKEQTIFFKLFLQRHGAFPEGLLQFPENSKLCFVKFRKKQGHW